MGIHWLQEGRKIMKIIAIDWSEILDMMFSPLPCKFLFNEASYSIVCSGGDRLRIGLKCVGGGTERAGCTVGADVSSLLLTTNEQNQTELQVELARSWWEGLQKPCLWWREPAWPHSTGCFPSLPWAGLPSAVVAWPHRIRCPVRGKKIIWWQFCPSLLSLPLFPATLSGCISSKLLSITAKRGGKKGGQTSLCFCGMGSSTGTEDLFNRGCWQYFCSPWGIQVYSSEGCFSLHSVILDSSYLKATLSTWTDRLKVLSPPVFTTTALCETEEKLQNFLK